MLRYIIRRLGIALVTLFLATILIFTIIQLPPGDFVDYMISQMSNVASEGTMVDVLRAQYGLDQPIVLQYFRWVAGIFRGDFGFSFLYNVPVIHLLRTEIVWTLIITGISFVIAWAIGICIGIYSATHKYSFLDTVLTFLGVAGLSIPPFFVAMLLIYWSITSGYGISGGLFSSEYASAAWSWAKIQDLMRHIWIPILAVVISNITEVMRVTRSSMIEAMSQPHVTTARAKGLKQSQVVFGHGVRLALNPLISMAGLMAPKLLNGIIMTAIVLNLPVMGPTFINALKSQDVYLAGAYLILMVIFLIAGNLLADIVLAWSDPRIRLESD